MNRGGIADLLLVIQQNSWEPSFWEVKDSYVLLAYASLAASRTLLQLPLQLLACLNFTLDSDDLLYWCKRKKLFVWTMAAAQAAENYRDEWCLTWHLQWGIYASIPIWTHTVNSLVAAEALSLKISSQGKSFKWSQRPSQSSQE